MTWDEICERADGYGYGSDELTAKDEARWQVRNLVLDKKNIDIEKAECPEEEVDHYTELWNIRFDESGNIECYKIQKFILIETKIVDMFHFQMIEGKFIDEENDKFFYANLNNLHTSTFEESDLYVYAYSYEDLYDASDYELVALEHRSDEIKPLLLEKIKGERE